MTCNCRVGWSQIQPMFGVRISKFRISNSVGQPSFWGHLNGRFRLLKSINFVYSISKLKISQKCTSLCHQFQAIWRDLESNHKARQMRLYLRIKYIAASGHFLTTFASKEHEGKRFFCIGNARPKSELKYSGLLKRSFWTVFSRG